MFYEPFLFWLAVHFGVESAGKYNLFWSGIGSDIGQIVLIGGAYGLWKKHNCHKDHCWRIGRHSVDGTPWCNHHHQDAREVLKNGQA